MHIVHIEEDLDRDKVLDEAIFIALCGKGHLNENCKITGLTRLQIARDGLNKVIKYLEEEMSK